VTLLAIRGLRILLAAALTLPAALNAELAGAPAPDFVLKSVAGPNFRLSEYRGRVVLLGFWASWCGDCRAQMRSLGELAGQYEGAGFDLLTVSLDGDSRQARNAVESLDIGFPVLLDLDGVVGETFEVDRMPYLAVIDRDGVVRAEFTGYKRGEEAEYIEQIRLLLDE